MISLKQLSPPTPSVVTDRLESHRPVLAADLRASWVNLEGLEALTSSWEFLAQHAVQRNPAFEANYLLPALKHLAGDSVGVLIVEDGSAPEGQEIVAVVPIETKRIYRLPFKTAEIWKHDQCFNATPLISKKHAADIWAFVCQFLAGDGYSLLSLDTVSAASEVDDLFANLEKESAVTRFQRDRFRRAGFTPETTADDYLMQHVSNSTRKKMHRYLGKMGRVGVVTWERSSNESDFDQLAEDFLRLEASGWKGDNGTALACSESSRSFYKDLVARSSALGKARFLSLKLDGHLVSMISDIQSGSTVYCYKTTYDENFASFSPGLQVEFKNVECLHQDGIVYGDSCTVPGPSSTSRVWGQSVEFQNVIFSLKPGLAQIAVRTLPLVQGAVKQLRSMKFKKLSESKV